MCALFLPYKDRPYTVDFVDCFVAKLAGVDYNNGHEKYKLIEYLNNVRGSISARIAYNGFCRERLLLVLEIEELMRATPNYSLTQDIYNCLEDSDRGRDARRNHLVEHIHAWSNLKQSPIFASFVLYIKKLIEKYSATTSIPKNYSMILLCNGTRSSGRETKKELTINICRDNQIIYKEIFFRFGKNHKKWISPASNTEKSVEDCVLDSLLIQGWKGTKFNKVKLKMILDGYNAPDLTIPCELKNQLCAIFNLNTDSYNKGLPDIMIWNDNEINFIEVKEHHDKLNDKQIEIARTIIQKSSFKYYLYHVVGIFE